MIINSPPIIAVFFKKDINCILLPKSVWKISVTVKTNKNKMEATILVLKPAIKTNGTINSKTNDG